jgi:hypothetical protein
MAQLNFDANNVEPRDSFDPIPTSWQIAEATDSEMKPTKTSGGEYLQIEWTITEGDFKNRKVWSRLNLKNANPTAVEIAQRDLSSICRATGVMQVQDSSALHGKPIAIKVKFRKGTDGYDDSNDVVGYKPRDGAPAPTGAGNPPATNGGSTAAPWARS